MWAALKVIRHRGYSFDDEEHAPGTRCVAATVYDEHAEPLGAISLAGPSSRLPDERIRQLGPGRRAYRGGAHAQGGRPLATHPY